jgi:hypothetical protein
MVPITQSLDLSARGKKKILTTENFLELVEQVIISSTLILMNRDTRIRYMIYLLRDEV